MHTCRYLTRRKLNWLTWELIEQTCIKNWFISSKLQYCVLRPQFHSLLLRRFTKWFNYSVTSIIVLLELFGEAACSQDVCVILMPFRDYYARRWVSRLSFPLVNFVNTSIIFYFVLDLINATRNTVIYRDFQSKRLDDLFAFCNSYFLSKPYDIRLLVLRILFNYFFIPDSDHLFFTSIANAFSWKLVLLSSLLRRCT